MDKKYKDISWLFSEYILKRKNIKDIAFYCGVKSGSVIYYMKKYGIKAEYRVWEARRKPVLKKVYKVLKDRGYTLLSEYKDEVTLMKLICPSGHNIEMKFGSIKKGYICSVCAGNKRKTIDEVRKIIDDTGYKLLSDSYNGMHSKTKIKCDKGHIYTTTFHTFINGGARCKKCYHINRTLEGTAYSRNRDKTLVKVKKYRYSGALYFTYNDQISFCEETRRDPENEKLLQVRCTESNCRKWFNPTNQQMQGRIKSLEGSRAGETRFYCSDECKNSCSIYRKSTYPKGFIPDNRRRYDQSEWSELVKERDNYTCQICGSEEDLVAHHFEGLNINPLESADIDIGITLCKKCHKEVHKNNGCRNIDLTYKSLCGEN